MNAVLDKQLAPLRLRWNGLQPRQRVVFATGAAVLAVALLIAFVWLPLERYRASLQKRVPELRASLAAMERDAEEVKRMRTLPATLNAPAPRALDAAQLRSAFTGAQVTALDGNRFRVQIAETSYAQWIDELRKLGAGLGTGAVVDEATLAIPASAGKGRVSVDAVIGPPGRRAS
jgi:type II secretory pathway component PulM